MGSDIFSSILTSLNGFPSLPIFIGDFLLTQLKQYFFIPVIILSIIVLFKVMTMGWAQAKHIVIRSIVAVISVFSILSFSMPMEQYVRETLNTYPAQIAIVDEDGREEIKITDVDLPVFRDIEHFAILEVTSAVVTYSDYLANALTRKIIYGTSDMAQITKRDGSGELRGFFPSLIYNVEMTRAQKAKDSVEKMLSEMKIQSYLKEMEAKNAEIKKAYQKFETGLCRAGVALNSFDSAVGERMVGIYANGIRVPRYLRKDGCETAFETHKIGEVANEKVVLDFSKAVSTALQSDPEFFTKKAIEKDTSALGSTYTANEKFSKDEIYRNILTHYENIVGAIKNKDITQTDLKNAKALNKPIQGLYKHDSNDPLKIYDEFLKQNLRLQIDKLKITMSKLASQKSESFQEFMGQISKAKTFDEMMPMLVTKYDEVVALAQKEIQNSLEKKSKNAKNVVITVNHVYFSDFIAQIQKTAISAIALYDFQRAASQIYADESKKTWAVEGGFAFDEKNIQSLKNMVGYSASSVTEVMKNLGSVDREDRKLISGDDIAGIAEKDGVNLANSMMSSMANRYSKRVAIGDVTQSMLASLAEKNSKYDVTDPYADRLLGYQNFLALRAAKIQEKSLQKLAGENGLERIRTTQGMFEVFNELRPEGSYPLVNYAQPISWQQLGVFYTVFKMTYENSVRDAYIISKIGAKEEESIKKMSEMSQNLSREKTNDYVAKVSGALAIGSTTVDILRGGGKDIPKASVTMMKILGYAFLIMFFINILLPTGIWFIVLMTYFIEISLYLAIAPIAIILMIFQVYHGAVQKFINVLIMLFLYPVTLVALFFIVLFLDMMLPILIFSFIPFFNDAQGLSAMLSVAWGTGFDSGTLKSAFGLGDFVSMMSAGGGYFAKGANLVSLIIMSALSAVLGIYLLFMLFRANTILAQTIQGSGFNMMEGQGFGQEAERKLRMLGGGVGAGAMM